MKKIFLLILFILFFNIAFVSKSYFLQNGYCKFVENNLEISVAKKVGYQKCSTYANSIFSNLEKLSGELQKLDYYLKVYSGNKYWEAIFEKKQQEYDFAKNMYDNFINTIKVFEENLFTKLKPVLVYKNVELRKKIKKLLETDLSGLPVYKKNLLQKIVILSNEINFEKTKNLDELIVELKKYIVCKFLYSKF